MQVYNWLFGEYQMPVLEKPDWGYCIIVGGRCTGKSTLAAHLLKDREYVVVNQPIDWTFFELGSAKAVHVREGALKDRSWCLLQLRLLIERCRSEQLLIVLETQDTTLLPSDLRPADYIFDTNSGYVTHDSTTFEYPPMRRPSF